jgi:hypothetical protein
VLKEPKDRVLLYVYPVVEQLLDEERRRWSMRCSLLQSMTPKNMEKMLEAHWTFEEQSGARMLLQDVKQLLETVHAGEQ